MATCRCDRGIACREGRQRRLIDVTGVNFCALACKTPRNRKPDAVGAGGDQHAATLDVEIHVRSGISLGSSPPARPPRERIKSAAPRRAGANPATAVAPLPA